MNRNDDTRAGKNTTLSPTSSQNMKISIIIRMKYYSHFILFSVYSWKLSRTQTLTDAANTAINNAITPVQVLDNQYYEAVDQSAASCLSYPDIPAGDPIIIPGQCGTVTPVANFQSTAVSQCIALIMYNVYWNQVNAGY